ncbi:MAG: hypothetical protein HY914_03385 [Desulfomonile tiedjei]|nr:hypothetical protein [Desulfomonile tiedjei]
MPEQEESNVGTTEAGSEAVKPEPRSLTLGKNIPRPSTTLAFHTKGKIEKAVVALLDDPSNAPDLDEVIQMNSGPASAGRTPLMTVILALLAKHGGSMVLEDLVAQALRHWNRPLPASPYTDMEFVYIIARNSDSIRVTG